MTVAEIVFWVDLDEHSFLFVALVLPKEVGCLSPFKQKARKYVRNQFLHRERQRPMLWSRRSLYVMRAQLLIFRDQWLNEVLRLIGPPRFGCRNLVSIPDSAPNKAVAEDWASY